MTLTTLNLMLTDLLDSYEKIVSAFVIETCKTGMTASALSTVVAPSMSIIYDIELNCTEHSLSNIDSPWRTGVAVC